MTNTPAESPDIPHPDQIQSGFELSTYEQGLSDNGVRTARHASEEGVAPPDDEIKLATTAIRRVLTPAFSVESAAQYDVSSDLGTVKTRYWEQAGRVGTEHGAKPGFELDDYLATSETRSYFSIKQDLLRRNPEGTLGRNLIDTVDLYHKALEINPAQAAAVVCELISRGRATIGDLAAQHGEMPPEDATRHALNEFIASSVPAHISRVLEEYGKGGSVAKALTKQSFYPQFDAAEAAPLAVGKEDVRALIEVFELQNRPYSRAELRMADDIAKLPAMQMAIIGVHGRLLDMSRVYLRNHPERLTGDMASWSEIFVPEEQPDGTTELLPNPKLVRAICNNVLPAVAGKLLGRGVDLDEMTAEDISEGATLAARTYKLFQSKIGLFRTNPQTGQIELGNITTVICPANQLFPRFLTQYLGADYAELAALEQSRPELR